MAASGNIQKPFRRFIIILIFIVCGRTMVQAQDQDTTFYLITCGTGTETYSYYGHSALRLMIGKSDTVYNWGIFDFNAPFFVYKFASGKLDYLVDDARFESFLAEYFYDKRFVVSQKINLDSREKRELLRLVNDNLKPENVRYKYDFFYDNCSTKIRDLLEKSIGENLIYPSVPDSVKMPTLRDMITKYQKQYPWYQFGVDMLIGSPAEKRTTFRETLFLPYDMKDGLSSSLVNIRGMKIPLLDEPQMILDFPAPVHHSSFLLSPIFVFSVVLIIVLLITALVRKKVVLDVMDLFLFTVFTLLAILMIFFNFITDHDATKWNFNILWLNPFLILCLVSILSSRTGKTWFRLGFGLAAIFLVSHLLLPQAFNVGIYPLLLIVLVRCYARAGFRWNRYSGEKAYLLF